MVDELWTERQVVVIEKVKDRKLVVLTGALGTGKTLVMAAKALHELVGKGAGGDREGSIFAKIGLRFCKNAKFQKQN